MVSDEQRVVSRDETKYGDQIDADRDWQATDDTPEEPSRTRVADHQIEVIYQTDPGRDDGYGREKYSATIRYDDETGQPYVLFVIEHRWKGNYWRDTTDWDWRDVPEPVRQQVADALPVEGPDALQTDTRLIEPGGESRWQKHHKPRMEALDGDEMWGLSYLKSALGELDNAIEAFDEGSSAQAATTKIAGALRKTIRSVDPAGDGEDQR